MDHRYPQDQQSQYELSRSPGDRSYQDSQGEYWIGSSQTYEDQQFAGSTPIDPQLYPATSPTILPPGTSVASYSGYRNAGYQGYTSSSPSPHPPTQYYQGQQQQPASGEGYGNSAYGYGEQSAASAYPQNPHGTDEVQSPG
ncbi:hypothetical protein TWF718_009284 [Orbilia javanica]